MAEPLAIVKVGKIECGFLKLTPLSRISAMAGAVSGVTFSARRPSGTNRIRLRGWLFWAKAIDDDNARKAKETTGMVRRMWDSLLRNRARQDRSAIARRYTSSAAMPNGMLV